MFTCSQCPTSFKNKTSLKEHVVKHHIGIKNFSCDTCGKEFYSKQNLRVVERLFMVQTKVTFLFGLAVFSVLWIRGSGSCISSEFGSRVLMTKNCKEYS
jgi:hypothetical protein